MLFLRTGLPGAGKTLNTIKDLDEEHQVDPDNPVLRLHKDPEHPELPPRTIYYHGIPELKVDKLKARWVEFDTPDRWYDLPDGSIVVIDEAQGTFGTDVRTRVDKVTRFEKHRHQGLDIHLITQHPSLICLPVRKLCGKHINFIRPYGRTKGVFRHEYEMCIDSPERRSNFKLSQESKIEFDSHYFNLYKSSTVHTHKQVTPSYMKHIWLAGGLIVAMIVLFVVGGYFMLKKYSGKKDDPVQVDQPANVVKPAVPGVLPAKASKVPDADDYVKDYKPRVPDVVSSAPRYDSLTKPRDYPRPICMASTDIRLVSTAKARGVAVGEYEGEMTACQCYSQQSTRLKTSLEFCMDVVRNGFFDDSVQQAAYASANSRGPSSQKPEQPDGLRRGPAGVDQKVVPHAFNEPTIVSNSEWSTRPWRGQ